MSSNYNNVSISLYLNIQSMFMALITRMNNNQLLHCIGFYSRVFVLFLFLRGVSRVKIKTKQIRVNKIQIQCNNGFIIYLCHSS